MKVLFLLDIILIAHITLTPHIAHIPLITRGDRDLSEKSSFSTVTLRIDLNIYNLECIKALAYRYTGEYHLDIEKPSKNEEKITINMSKKNGTIEDPEFLKKEFMNDLIDQALREKISSETSNLKQLIIAQAFSKTNLIDNE